MKKCGYLGNTIGGSQRYITSFFGWMTYLQTDESVCVSYLTETYLLLYCLLTSNS